MVVGGNDPIEVEAWLEVNGFTGDKKSFTVIPAGQYAVEVIGPDAIERGTQGHYVYKIRKEGVGVIKAGQISWGSGAEAGSDLRTLKTVTVNGEDVEIKKNIAVVEFAGVDKEAVPVGVSAALAGRTNPEGYEDRITWLIGGEEVGGGGVLNHTFSRPGSQSIKGMVTTSGLVWKGENTVELDVVEIQGVTPTKTLSEVPVTFTGQTSPGGYGGDILWDGSGPSEEYTKTFNLPGMDILNTRLDIDGVKGKCRAFDIGVEECFMGSDDECHRCFHQQDYQWEEKPGPEDAENEDCVVCAGEDWEEIEPAHPDDVFADPDIKNAIEEAWERSVNAEGCDWGHDLNTSSEPDDYEDPFCEHGGWIIQDGEGDFDVIEWAGGSVVEADAQNEFPPLIAQANPEEEPELGPDQRIVSHFHTHPWTGDASGQSGEPGADWGAAESIGLGGAIVHNEGDGVKVSDVYGPDVSNCHAGDF